MYNISKTLKDMFFFFHSMGGHGALLCALLNPEKYKSVSAFAPATNISISPTLIDGLTTLLGNDKESLQKWDPTFLAKNYDGPEIEILIHVVCISILLYLLYKLKLTIVLIFEFCVYRVLKMSF